MTTAPGNDPIYLDYNATTPLHPEVAAAMKPYLTGGFGNPSSSHRFGAENARAVSQARREVATLINAELSEVIFTGGGSESNNLAIRGAARNGTSRGRHVITSAIEHPAVAQVCSYLEREGFKVTRVPVDRFGRVDPADVESAVRPDTVLISVMHGNNEIGTIQPIRAIATIARRYGALVHTDAAQTVGKIPVDVRALGVDLLSIAAHKLYGPKGVGALFVREGVRIEKILFGADHERDLRPGTENVMGIVGFGAAATAARREAGERGRHTREARDLLWRRPSETGPPVPMNGHPEERLPNTLSVSFHGVDANTLLSALPGLAASAGAACHADSLETSPVIEALGVAPEDAMGTVRFSTGRFLSRDDIERAAVQIVDAARRLVPEGRAHERGGAPAESAAGEVRLTRFTHGMGCACKLPPGALEAVLRRVPVRPDPRVIGGFATADDAALFAIDDERLLIQTVDFFTPVVDDPYDFGAIAAANALSDVYAMGGKPLFALSIVAFPMERLPLEVLDRILAGAADVAGEAGVSIVGGHSIDDREPKYGLAVTGEVARDRVFTNGGARPGDRIILTKPIGTGIIATAIKRDLASEAVTAAAIATMKTTNRMAADLLAEAGTIHAVTDVTGFGLIGHALEVARASGVSLRIDPASVPVLDEVRDLAGAGVVPGGTKSNLAYVSDHVKWEPGVSSIDRTILCDAQTSGGLLVSAPPDAAGRYVKLARDAGIHAVDIGEALGGGDGGTIVVSRT